MAITVTGVKQVRKFDYSTDNPSGRAKYDVFFSVDTSDEYADYNAKVALCLTAVDPVTGLAVPKFGEQLGSFDTYVRDVNPQLYRG